MYSFIDAAEAAEGFSLPTEALQINGVYIEQQISGYRTLHVSGREALAPELTTYETGARDGAVLQSRRFPPRTITVTYQLLAASAEAYREAYNRLASILNTVDAQLIFNDEQDKFFRGTPCAIPAPEPGRNAVVGSFEILCVDPFKYSVVEYTAEPDSASGSFLIGYNGTYRAYPTLEARFYKENESTGVLTGSGDCGFVAFFNEAEKIIQLGDPEEEDIVLEEGVKSEVLVNQTFQEADSWNAAEELWSVNDADGLPLDVAQNGTPGIRSAQPEVSYLIPETEGVLLDAKSSSEKPRFTYRISARAYNRTADSVTLDIAITAALLEASATFGYTLAGSFYINKQWHEVIFRDANDPVWEGNTGHTKNLTFTVTGLKDNTTSVSGMKFKAYRLDSYDKAGTLNATWCKSLKISKYLPSAGESFCLSALDYGAGDKWHCTAITRDLPVDGVGERGMQDFVLTYRQRFSLGTEKNNTQQWGAFTVLLTDDSGNRIAGLRICKNKNGGRASFACYVGDAMYMEKKEVDVSHKIWYDSKTANAREQTTTITKSGSQVTFNLFSGVKQVYTNEAIADARATRLIFAFEAFADKTPLTYNGICWAKAVKDNCADRKDIPNKFTANDIVQADCRTGQILLNGVSAPELGALGNDWEEFALEPGVNRVGFAWSSWLAEAYAPQMRIRYREVFL